MTVWRRKDDWVGSQVEDQYVMIHLDSGRYMALNQTAAEAWHALDTPRTREELVGLFVGRFQIGEQDCGRSVDAMLDKMSQMGLIEHMNRESVSTPA